jgi:drug/metabolite transporter (DMT)-like permease
MALKIGIVISVISIILLSIYGADAIVTINENLGSTNTAFLHMDTKTRGMVFGLIPAILLILSFFITRNESSKILGILIIVGGALMVVGVGIILALPNNNITPSSRGEFLGVVGIGVSIVALGTIKVKRSKRNTAS